MKTTILILLLYCSACSNAQELTIKGLLRNSDNNPIPFANIIVTNPSHADEIITYSFTDNDGSFTIAFQKGIPALNLTFSAIGYKELTQLVRTDSLRFLTITMQPDEKQLETIVVKTQSFKDTVNLKLDSMNLTNESTLRDILGKTEGVQVSKDGAILFNGRAITKILINNKEVFINQNKIALDNLNYEIMDNVQIISNYKDKFNIDFNNPTNPIINVKTKAKFKGVLKWRADVGAGYYKAYKIKGKGMFFSDKVNAFLTSNTNNISEKDLSYADVSAPVIANSSDNFKSTMLSFFSDDNLLKKDFNSNNTLVLRSQTSKAKTGLALTYANMNIERSSITTIKQIDTLIKNESNVEKQHGNLFAASVNNSFLLKKKTVLNSNATLAIVAKNNLTNIFSAVYHPARLNLAEQTANKPAATSIVANSTLTSLITKKALFNIAVDYFAEQYKHDLNAALSNYTNNYVDQQNNSSKSIVSFYPSVTRKINNWFALNSGVVFSKVIEKGDLRYTAVVKKYQSMARNQNIFQFPLVANGQTKKIEYTINVKPSSYTLLHTNGPNKFYIATESFFSYKFNPSENILAKFNRLVYLQDLNNSFDTLFQSYNFRTANAADNKYNFTNGSNFNIGYYYSNIASSKSFYINYVNQQDRNYILPIFDTIINNTFYYNNAILSNKESNTITINGSKGYYFSPQYHKIDCSVNASYIQEKFPTIVNHLTRQYQNNKMQLRTEVILNFRNFLAKEITLGTYVENQRLQLNSKEINKQALATIYLNVSSSTPKTEWRLYMEDAFYRTSLTSFQIPNCNLSFMFKRTEKLAFSITGKSLFNLFKLNTATNTYLNTFSDGNIITQIINNNRIGYLLFNTIYRF